jgi:tetratricopeptide (TPR) repeat protein
LKTSDWLRLLLQIFYAPTRGIREVRDRASLAPSAVVALITTAIFFFTFTLLFFRQVLDPAQPVVALSLIIQSASLLVLVAGFFSPLILFLTNVLDRRASFRLLFQQEYSSLTCSLFYALAASSLFSTIITIAGKFSGVQDALAGRLIAFLLSRRSELRPEILAALDQGVLGPAVAAVAFSFVAMFLIFFIWSLLVIRIVCRLSWLRAIMVVVVAGILTMAGMRILPILGTILASPFLLIVIFLLLRGFISDATRTHRARESFKQNLEAATLNPADSSAHYNLGLIHQQRGELDAARERFERAVQIDQEEVDAHYQLGRIARQQQRLADAIRHFEQVVARDRNHAQQEVWREIGATYVAAGQFADAVNALDSFLERRPSDPEALYLMGRAHAGLGHRREATSSMQACIEAVKTAPAYKYRAEKRWLNEAQQFLRSQV